MEYRDRHRRSKRSHHYEPYGVYCAEYSGGSDYKKVGKHARDFRSRSPNCYRLSPVPKQSDSTSRSHEDNGHHRLDQRSIKFRSGLMSELSKKKGFKSFEEKRNDIASTNAKANTRNSPLSRICTGGIFI